MNTKIHKFATILSVVALLTVVATTQLFAQGNETDKPQKQKVSTLVDSVYFMPYITGSANFHSGEAFPKGATGLGYGFGLAFDLTKDGQRLGAYFDFAFQDMRAAAEEGGCMNQTSTDSLLSTVRAEHYYQYLQFETFLKLQGEHSNGYLLAGLSFGYAVLAETFYRGLYRTTVVDWKGTDYFNPLRVDIRIGLGVVLAHLGTHKLILEARAGYPITNAISNYNNICTGTGIAGGWRIVTLQANLGYRF